jgi:hypothetical protein
MSALPAEDHLKPRTPLYAIGPIELSVHGLDFMAPLYIIIYSVAAHQKVDQAGVPNLLRCLVIMQIADDH